MGRPHWTRCHENKDQFGQLLVHSERGVFDSLSCARKVILWNHANNYEHNKNGGPQNSQPLNTLTHLPDPNNLPPINPIQILDPWICLIMNRGCGAWSVECGLRSFTFILSHQHHRKRSHVQIYSFIFFRSKICTFQQFTPLVIKTSQPIYPPCFLADLSRRSN